MKAGSSLRYPVQSKGNPKSQYGRSAIAYKWSGVIRHQCHYPEAEEQASQGKALGAIEIAPVAGRSAFLATHDIAPEFTSGLKVVDGKGEVEW